MIVLEKWAPFRDLELMEQRLRRLFPATVAPTTPAADIVETKDEVIFELEVPGYEEKELDVEVSDHTLTISGHRKTETTSTENKVRLHERLDSAFERIFELPPETDTEHLKATYGKGVLTLRVPKAAQSTPVKIPVSTA